MVATMGGSQVLQDKVNARVTDEELEMMKEFGIEDGDGYVRHIFDVTCSISCLMDGVLLLIRWMLPSSRY